MRSIIITAIVSLVFLSACASSIPTTSRMSDVIMMGIKTSQTKTIGYEFNSRFPDGLIKPCNKDTRDEQSGHPGYLHTEGTTLDKMIRDYLSMKFTSVENSANTKLRVVLTEFWLEQFSLDSTGKQFLVALGGGELNIMVVANLVLVCEISKDGYRVNKVVRVSGDSAHVSGIGTGTSTSNLFRGTQSIEFRVADAMNSANNKFIIMLNQFIESNQL